MNILSTKHLPLTKGCPSLPSHMHVKVGTLDELPFHRIDFQASDEHENGSDCDSLDDDEDDEVSLMTYLICCDPVKKHKECY